MILECTGCRKAYRVKDEATPPSQKCPSCGAELKVSATASGSWPSPVRMKELEDKVRQLERELQDARASSGPSLSQAGGFGFADGDSQRLERQLLDQKSESERALAIKERALHTAEEAVARAEAERRGLEARIESLDQSHRKALEEKQKTLDALDASLESYREKIDAAQKKIESLEAASRGESTRVEEKSRAREEALRAEADRSAEEHRRALAELRSELERQIEEKDRQISEGREILDREAGERRRLGESVTRLQESLDRTVAEKDQAIASLQASVASHKNKADSLRKRLGDVEELRKADQESYTAKIRARDGEQARVAEAGHLASDLDHSLDSVADLLRGLRDRVTRLKDNLSETRTAAPARAVEPLPEPIQEAPLAEPDLIEETPAPEPEFVPVAEPVIEEAKPEEFSGRVEAPSSIGIPAVTAEEPKADEGTDLPLISPPEDEAPVAKAPEAPKPSPAAEGRRVTRFSWKKS